MFLFPLLSPYTPFCGKLADGISLVIGRVYRKGPDPHDKSYWLIKYLVNIEKLLDFRQTYTFSQPFLLMNWQKTYYLIQNSFSPSNFLSNKGSHDILWGINHISAIFGWCVWKRGGLRLFRGGATQKFLRIRDQGPQWPLFGMFPKDRITFAF